MSKPKKRESDGVELPSEITPEVAEVLKDIPADKRRMIYRAVSLSIKRHQGPLPDGETIAIYNAQIPNGGDRIMSTVEKQLDHRIRLESIGIRRSFNQSGAGQWMAFVIAIIFGAISWDLVKSGHDSAGMLIAGVDIVGLVTAFIYGKASQQK